MHSTPLLSVVIPTHKRPQILRECLACLERQTVADQMEVIVVSDGHDPETARLFETPDAGRRIPVRYVEIPKSQQGAARNRGVKEAKAALVLFIGDDIFLAPDACALHVKKRHAKRAVLGFTTWDPAAGITPVMKWLERSGWQFGYPKIKRYAHSVIPSSKQHSFTYTSNISLPTTIAKKYAFREDVTLYGWEDIEWGFRLREAGVQLFYEPDAKALHHHHLSMEQSLKRMEILGRSAREMDRMRPELTLVPRGRKLLKYRIAARLPGMRGRHARSFLRGMKIN